MQPCAFEGDRNGRREWADVDKQQAARIRQAAKKIERAEKDLATARAAFRATLEAIHGEGASLASIGEEIGVTRQRVAQIIRG